MLRALPAPFAWPGDGVPFRQARRFWLDPEARPPKPVVMGDLFQSRAAGGGGGDGAPTGPHSSALGGVRFAEKKFFAVQWRCGGLRRWGAPREPAQGFRGSAGGLPSVGRVHAVRRAAAAPAGAVALAEGRDDDAVAVVGGPLGLDIGLHRQSAVSYRQRARS